jgi:hypothetical protein
MYGTPLAGEEQKQAEGVFTPGHETVTPDVHVRGLVLLRFDSIRCDSRSRAGIYAVGWGGLEDWMLRLSPKASPEPHTQPSKVPPEVEIRDSRFTQALIAEWFGTTVFVLFLVLVRGSKGGKCIYSWMAHMHGV